MEHLDAVGGQAHLDALADQRVRNRVIGPADFDVVVGMHLARFLTS